MCLELHIIMTGTRNYVFGTTHNFDRTCNYVFGTTYNYNFKTCKQYRLLRPPDPWNLPGTALHLMGFKGPNEL